MNNSKITNRIATLTLLLMSLGFSVQAQAAAEPAKAAAEPAKPAAAEPAKPTTEQVKGLADKSKPLDLVCSGPQMGEIFIDITNGSVTKNAEESVSVPITMENSRYGFVYKGKISKFKATINRANGQIILDDACTPQCWGGPIFGTCTTVKAKF